MRRDDCNRVRPHMCRNIDVVENVVVATGRGVSQQGLKVTKARPKDTSDPSARVQKCSPVRGDERTKRMRSELSRNCKRDPVSSVRAQSAKCVTGQNTSEQRGSVEHIALC